MIPHSLSCWIIIYLAELNKGVLFKFENEHDSLYILAKIVTYCINQVCWRYDGTYGNIFTIII